MENHTCKNCEHSFSGHFCSECGQKSKTQRLDWHFLNDELKYTFLHVNKGLLYTAKQLYIRPGHTVREFIEGKRVNHYKPILLVFVLGGIYSLMGHYLSMDSYIQATQQSTGSKAFDMKKIYEWTTSHFALIELSTIPVMSFCSWLAFKSWGYNYIEHIILNTFASAQRLIYSICIFPIVYLLSLTKVGPVFIPMISFVSYFLTAWTYIQFFKGKDLGQIILRLLLFGFLDAIMIMILIVAGIVVYLSIYGLPKV